jgi:DNA topoisomerase-1
MIIDNQGGDTPSPPMVCSLSPDYRLSIIDYQLRWRAVAKKAIIVESPTKTRTLGRFLGKEYTLLASRGHVRDLPEKDLAVDVQHDFQPKYVVIPRQRKTLKELREALQGMDEVYLASDPDREGEAIAWHLAHALGLQDAKRIEFNEITEQAVREALGHPRGIDMRLVDAQQARRVLDRLVGYEISPLLWRSIGRTTSGGLSAGRVQSVALRLIVDREREIQAFVPEEYWSIEATLTPEDKLHPFTADLKEKAGEKVQISSEAEAQATVADLQQQAYQVGKFEEKDRQRSAQPPFITSTLQRAAASELGFSASKTMRVAQALYEGVEIGGETVGLITYMRTDSTRVAAPAREQAVGFIAQQFGENYVGPGVRGKTAKGAQEAHECIRPTSVLRTPESLAPALDKDQARLYELIWRRFVASQMAPAVLHQRGADILAGPYLLRATSSEVVFPGFLAVLPDREKEEGTKVPVLTVGQALRLLGLKPEQHFTQPPPRYNEASLVQALEEKGIGRPSTYAPTIETLRSREYVRMEKRNFVPTRLGIAVCDYLVDHFPGIMDVEFTARMEEDLDTVEQGERDWVALLRDFWGTLEGRLAQVKGEGDVYLEGETCPECGGRLRVRYSAYGKFAGCENYPACSYKRDLSGLAQTEAAEPEELEEPCPECGGKLIVRESRYGKFAGCANYPKCKYTRDLSGRPRPVKTDLPCENCGKALVLRQGRRGPFLGCSGYPKCRFTREPTAQELAALTVPAGQPGPEGE